jgi:tetratricopeptide (TPR) repeat protein
MTNLIEKYPVPLILKKIHKDRLSGELQVQGEGFSKSLYFIEGELQYAFSNLPQDRLGEVLYTYEKISLEQLIMLRKMKEVSTDKFGKILVQHRILSHRGLYNGLQLQVKAIGISLFNMVSGEWQFSAGAEAPEAAQQYNINLEDILIDGCASLADYSYYISRFNFRSPVVMPMPEAIGTLLSSDEIKFYVMLTKCHSASCEQIISLLNVPESMFWHQVVQLYLLNIIDFTEFRVDEELNKQIELINDLHHKITTHAIDHYELLALKDTASVSEVRDRYFSFTKQYHPDAIEAPPDSRTMEKTDFVFKKVTQAFDTLSHEEKKRNYDTGQFKMVPVEEAQKRHRNEEKDKVQKARTLYLKAHSHYDKKEFLKAVRLLDEAVNLDIKRANYYLLLGLSQIRVPSLRPYAEKNLQKVAEMEPWNADPLFYLGQLYMAENLVKKAEKQFRKALEINMEHTLAAKMIKKIENKGGKKSRFSLFGR